MLFYFWPVTVEKKAFEYGYNKSLLSDVRRWPYIWFTNDEVCDLCSWSSSKFFQTERATNIVYLVSLSELWNFRFLVQRLNHPLDRSLNQSFPDIICLVSFKQIPTRAIAKKNENTEKILRQKHWNCSVKCYVNCLCFVITFVSICVSSFVLIFVSIFVSIFASIFVSLHEGLFQS